jgi:hypothetical protein
MKWEYKVYSWDRPIPKFFGKAGAAIPADEMTAALNTLGNEGWEAVSVFPVEMAQGVTSQTNSVGILLKRAVPE